MKYVLSLMLTIFYGVYGEAISLDSVGYYYLPPLTNGADIQHPKGGAISLDLNDPLQKTVQNFLEKNAGNKLGLVIGRGNVQGIAEERITIDSLKGLQWLFVDPADTLGKKFHDNQQDEAQGNALKTTWPLSFSLEGQFDAVVFDYGTIQYIGHDGEAKRLGIELGDKQMDLRVTQPNGDVISKSSFDAPYKFQDWLTENKPVEFVAIEQAYAPLIAEAKRKQKETLIKGLKDAYASVRAGGTLIVPIDSTLSGISLPEILGVPKNLVVKKTLDNFPKLNQQNSQILNDGTTYTFYDGAESPVLPEITKGMKTWFSDFYTVTKPQ